MVKESYEPVARELFGDTNVHITTAGHPYLGAPLGSDQYVTEFIQSKVDFWKSIVLALSEIASSQPHVAYSAFTCGVSHLWEFLCRITPNIAHWNHWDISSVLILSLLLQDVTLQALSNVGR